MPVLAARNGQAERRIMMMNITITPEDPRSLDAAVLMQELSACLAVITGDGGQSSFHVEDVCVPGSLFVLARNEKGEAVGCGAFRLLEEKTAEIKRMYVRERYAGLGSRILCCLEQQAAAMGYDVVRLETRKVNQGAVAFYMKNGYQVIPNYGRYRDRPEAICFEKQLNHTSPL